MTPRDFINVGIFTALYFVVLFSAGMIGLAGPVFILVGGFVGTLLGGIVITLYILRTPKLGALTLLGGIIGLLFTLSGHFFGVIVLGIIFGFLADLIITRDKSKLPSRIPLAYAVFSIMMVGPLIPIFINADAYFAEVGSQMGDEYAAGMRAIFQPWIIGVWVLASIVFGYLGGLLGVRVCRKHFSRAGLA